MDVGFLLLDLLLIEEKPAQLIMPGRKSKKISKGSWVGLKFEECQAYCGRN
jgi:hypothetical protein